jgi:hypothetical protein
LSAPTGPSGKVTATKIIVSNLVSAFPPLIGVRFHFVLPY